MNMLKGQQLLFLISPPRSGSSLLAAILGSHSKILAPPETWLMLQIAGVFGEPVLDASLYDNDLAVKALKGVTGPDTNALAAGIASSVYKTLLQGTDKSLLLDKTPRYYLILRYLRTVFPAARFVWLQRNPLDIIASCHKTWNISVDEMTGKPITPHTLDTTVSFVCLAEHYAEAGDRTYVVHYEDLVTAPEKAVESLCGSLSIDYEPSMINYGTNTRMLKTFAASCVGDRYVLAHGCPHEKSVDTWKRILSPAQVQLVLKTLGKETFLSHGYEQTLHEAMKYAGLADLPDGYGRIPEIRKYMFSIKPPESGLREHAVATRAAADLQVRLNETEADRAARLKVIEEQGRQLGAVTTERNNLLSQRADLRKCLEAAEADRAARLTVIEKQGTQIGKLDEQSNLLRSQLEELQKHFEASEADRVARLKVIEEQGRQLGDVTTEWYGLLSQLADLRKHLETAEADRAARLTVIEKQGTQIGKLDAQKNLLRSQLEDLQKHYTASEADRAARLRSIEEQGRELGDITAERNNLLAQRDDLSKHLEIAEFDRAARLAVIEEQGRHISEVDAQRNLLRAQIEDLQKHFAASEVDRAARLRAIEEQGRELGDITAERNNLLSQVTDLHRHIEASEVDRAARLAVIERQGVQIGQLDAQLNLFRSQLEDLQNHFKASEADRADRLLVIEEQGRQLGDIIAERNTIQSQLAVIESELRITQVQAKSLAVKLTRLDRALPVRLLRFLHVVPKA